MGTLIVVEGIDGAGKTTQVGLLADALRTAGEEIVLSREPTDGPWGQKIRQSAQNGRMAPQDELAAFIEDRREHVAKVIGPALAARKIVLLDRYYYSTIAYQGARGIEPEELAQRMPQFAPVPDVVLFLDIPPALAIDRISTSRGDVPNEFERIERLTAVRRVFTWLANSDPLVARIAAERSIEEVHRQIVQVLLDGVLAKYKAKPYPCDCWYCSAGQTDQCRWLRLAEGLHRGLAFSVPGA